MSYASNKEADNIRLLVSKTPLHKLTTVIVDYIIQYIKDTTVHRHSKTVCIYMAATYHGSHAGNRDTVYMA